MSGGASEGFNLPKVVEEDIDSLASYPNSSRSRSPAVLVGGGRVDSDAAASETRAPSTLRGGGRLHPAFTNSDPSAPSKRCETGCCGVCGQGVEKDDIVVRPQVMHASCLRCEACDCLLTSSTFRAVDGHVYCEKDYKKYFVNREGTHSSPHPKVVAVRPGVSDKKFEEMNRAIMESFTSVDDFLAHMRQLREKHDRKDGELAKASSGDQSQVRRAGDVGVDRQTHYEREQVTSPSGTPWITERVVDKKVKTKVLEKRYPASAIDPCETPASIKSRLSAPAAVHANESKTLIGGGGRPASNASRPSTSLLNDTTSLNGWDHPLCPVCNAVVYLNDRVTHEGYGYHKACMRCRQCSQVVPVTSAIRIKGAIYCKKHGNDLLRRRSILMRKKSTMGRRSRHNRRRSGVSRERFTVESGDAVPAVPPVPDMPMFSSGNGNSSNLPVPSIPHESGAPRRVTTALRHFLEAAAEQIENNSLMPVTPEPIGRSMTGPSTPVSQQPRATSISSEQQRRPLPVPKPKPGQLDYQAQKQQQKQQQEQVQQRPPYSLPSSPPQSPPPSGQRTGSRSIFSGSRDSLYDPNVVNALRQEAQRQINGSQASISGSRHSSASSHDMSHRMLSPCGPSIVDILHFGSNSRQDQMNASSQFDPFADSHEQLSGGGFASPQGRIGGAFSPNAQLDNLERRFRNANFRPPWALKSQTMFE
ncbi:hypothetical protein BX070DRAFT_226097 [Coemansia spiralis]|nr:hypothetical protein BX070DRAFT_226097 [Coemansia spiralis]